MNLDMAVVDSAVVVVATLDLAEVVSPVPLTVRFLTIPFPTRVPMEHPLVLTVLGK
jgi:hypothetical protein